MDKLRRVEGVAASFRRPNIDTDAIIPAAYQRSLKLDPGLGLFGGWRYDLEGREIPEFILNREPYRHSRIIVGGPNFGCGSSREFAVWAIKSFGISCVIAESFGDIFYENCFKNGLLPIVLPAAEVDALHNHLDRTNDPVLAVDLETCTIALPNGSSFRFSVPESRRHALLEGLDEIGQTLLQDERIGAFQDRLRQEQPWIFLDGETIGG